MGMLNKEIVRWAVARMTWCLLQVFSDFFGELFRRISHIGAKIREEANFPASNLIALT